MLTCITNCQSSINSKTKLNEVISNIDEHDKMNSVFSRICFAPCASSVLFDDGEVHCRVYDQCLSQMYKQTISKLSLESELDLLKYCNTDILILVFTQNKLKCTSCCCVRLVLQNRKISKKLWQIGSSLLNLANYHLKMNWTS